ncbi:MAG: nucleotidyltransferase domain-containing protein [Patescibacteria group bacterium]|nr:nucleotidyltransferase domain-containing protein [Patescibacteria group bacterium]MDD4304707.1 nucleotidyltransferase domain-containing protein [Patescibacteria group bacterium]MDD4695731.1 nucleotidyltransferase domain-containing protein [Patescibacteria group bacterium]
MNKKESMLIVAIEIATCIIKKTNRIMHKTLLQSGFGVFMNLLEKFGNANKNIPNAPEIHDIFIFGSLATDEENPKDIDICVVDNGFFSWYFNEHKESREDAYHMLKENLNELFGLWFGSETEEIEKMANGFDVDLHLLPVDFFKDPKVRNRLLSKHDDPNFYRNSFYQVICLTPGDYYQKKVGVEYFQERYGKPLEDLKFF